MQGFKGMHVHLQVFDGVGNVRSQVLCACEFTSLEGYASAFYRSIFYLLTTYLTRVVRSAKAGLTRGPAIYNIYNNIYMVKYNNNLHS